MEDVKASVVERRAPSASPVGEPRRRALSFGVADPYPPPMQFLSVGQRAEGVIAIGQEATGFFALGQSATGIIAIGQIARGVIAIGQGAIGIVTLAQGGLGLSWCMAMIGAGGVRPLGLVLPLVGAPRRTKQVPATKSLEAIRRDGMGWVGAMLSRVGQTQLVAEVDGERVPVKAAEAKLFLAAYGATRSGSAPFFLELASGEGGFRLLAMRNPPPRKTIPLGLRVAQFLLLIVGAWAFMEFAAMDIVAFLGRFLLALMRGDLTLG